VNRVRSDPRKLREDPEREDPESGPERSPEVEFPVYVSVVIPCHNGSAFLLESLTRLMRFLRGHRSLLGEFEVLFVDDGSTDDSAALVRKHHGEVRVLQHPTRRGKGAAVRTGVLAAVGRFVCFMDADVPYELDALPVALDYLDRKEFDLCIGTRSGLATAALLRRSWPRRLASWVFTLFVSRIVVTGVRDTQCGFKAFRRDVARYLFGQSRVDNFAFDVEVLYLAFKNDLDVKRIPVALRYDEVSSVSLTRHALPMLCSILKLPIHYYGGGYERMAGRERPR